MWEVGGGEVKSHKQIGRVNFISFPENKPSHIDTGYLVQIKGLGAYFVQASFDGKNWWDNEMNCITTKVGRISDVAIFEFINW